MAGRPQVNTVLQTRIKTVKQKATKSGTLFQQTMKHSEKSLKELKNNSYD